MEHGKRFKKARLKIDYTQKDMANELGVSEGIVSKYESSRLKEPNLNYLRYLKGKGVSSNWLLYGEGEMMEADNVKKMPSDYEEIKKENSYLRNEIEKLKKEIKEQHEQFMNAIHTISGKPSEHKKAASPNEKRKNNYSFLGKSYVPATIN